MFLLTFSTKTQENDNYGGAYELCFCRSNRALQISHPMPPTHCETGSTTNTTLPGISFNNSLFLEHHHQHVELEHQSMPDPTAMLQSGNHGGKGSVSPVGEESSNSALKPPMSLPYVPAMTSTTTVASTSCNMGHHRFVKNKLAQPKFPRTPFVKKHSAYTTPSSRSGDVHNT